MWWIMLFAGGFAVCAKFFRQQEAEILGNKFSELIDMASKDKQDDEDMENLK